MKKKLLICLLLTVICFWHFNVKAEGIADAITEDAVASEVISNEEIVGTESETEEESDDESDDETKEESELETDEETGTDEEDLVEEKEEDTTDETEKEEETTEEVTTTDDVEEENNEEGNTEILEEVEEENENYEVTFSHNEYRLSIKGGSSILLSKLTKKLGIDISMSDVENITISNEEVLKIVNVENSNDFVIQSLKSFNTEEELIIKLKDGREIIIKVVDPVGKTPDHDKGLVDNGDGTYTISLTVTGDAEKQVNKVNVIIVLDTSGSMDENTGNGEITYTATNTNGDNLYGLVNGEYVSLTRYGNGNNSRYYYNGYTRYYGTRYLRTDTSQDRLEAAQEAVNQIADSLLSNNGENGNPTDTVEMALVTFATNSNVRIQKTTSYSTFSTTVNNLNATGGTNWEAALRAANGIDFNDNDQIYIIFVSDGNPTFRTTANGHNDRYQSGIYGTGYEEEPNITRAYETAVPAAKEIVNEGKKFYTIGAYGNVDRMEGLTTESGAPARNYYSAANTAALKEALGAILSEIEMAGIGAVSINDGTTNSVTTSSGVSHLLDVDKNSFKYYKDDEEWTDAPEATLNSNGEVVWDLSSEGVLDNDVTYKVTFVVWPSQTTLDLIADLKNDPDKYDTLDANIKKYLVKDGDGYTLLTNTTASLSFKDTREENPQTHTSTYTNPDPVNTSATQLLTITKKWDNNIDARGESPVEIKVLKDGEDWYKFDLSNDNGWTGSANIAIGIMIIDDNGEVVIKATGHDFSFGELGDDVYNWEMKSEIVRPMLVDGELTILVRYGTEAPTSGTYYKIDNYYYVVSDAVEGIAKLEATNERRSWVDLEKTVNYSDNAAHFDDQIFTFDITVGEAGGEDIWFSIMDKATEALIKLADNLGLTVTGATEQTGDSAGYFVATSGSTFTVGIKTGWNVRLLNLLTGTTYTITETNIDSKFEFDKINYLNTTYKDEDGEDVEYKPTITNTSVTGEVMGTNTKYGYEFVNKNVATEITVTKVWEDEDNKYNNRPNDIVLKLSDGTSVIAQPTKTDNGDGTWTYVYTNLNVYDEDGKLITYTLTEDTVLGYLAGVITGDAKEGFTVTNTLETVNIIVNKTWSDNNDQDGLRPTTITLTLSNGDTVELTKDGNWTKTVEDLPKYVDGSEFSYTVTEKNVPTGYQVTYSEDGLTAINTHTPATDDVVVTKVWEDSSNKEGLRPGEITIHLLANGTEVKVTPTIAKNGDTWTFTYSDLDVNANGSKITYTVTEDTVTNYETEIDGLTITNSREVETTEITIKKIWEDNDNQDGKRPEEVTVTLSNGDTVKLTKAEGWTKTVTGLQKYVDGEEVVYTVVKELEVEGYKVSYSDDTLTITNTHTPEKADVVVEKVWKDSDNEEGLRPTTITVHLFANGTEVEADADIVKNNDNTWTITFSDLDVYANGEKITYTVTEDEVDKYKTTIEGLKITNSRDVEYVEIKCEKVWDDGDNAEGFRPDEVTVNLLMNDEVIDTVKLNKDGNAWKYSWGKLNKYVSGNEVKYSITEDEVDNYETDIEYNEDDNAYIITNTHKVERTNVTVKKIWVDDNDRDGVRSKKVIITIMKTIDGLSEKVKDIELNDGNEWTETIKDLLKYENGKEVTYTAVENDVPKGYVESYSEDTFTITNTHEIETNDIVVTKVWEDEDNESGKRPESVTIILLADGEECGRIELSSDNDWTHTFEGMPVYDEDHKEITYSVSEEVVPKDYEVAYEETKDGFIIHNVLGKGDGNPPENPQTGSNIVLYLIALLISIIGLIGGKHYLKENN